MKKAYRRLTSIMIVICSLLIGFGLATGLPGVSLLGFIGFQTIVLLYLYSRRYLLRQDFAIYICFFTFSLLPASVLFGVFPSFSLDGNTIGRLLILGILSYSIAFLFAYWRHPQGELYSIKSQIGDYKEAHSLDDYYTEFAYWRHPQGELYSIKSQIGDYKEAHSLDDSYTDIDAYRDSDFENDHVSVRTQDHKYPTQRGEWVRSEQEAIIADVLFRLRIKYDYERPLRYPGIHEMILPDFTIYWNNVVYYWEHLGMLDNEEYKHNWERRKKWYHDAGYADELIVSTSDDLDTIERFVKDKFPS